MSYRYLTNGAVSSAGNLTTNLSGTQYTESEGHKFSHNSENTGDVGGEFFTTKSYVSQKQKHLTRSVSITYRPPGFPFDFSRTEKGLKVAKLPAYDSRGNPIFPASAHSSRSELEKLGTTAIARCAPGNPPAEAATFLGELLHDGFPSAPVIRSWQNRTKAAQALGSEYLNVVFGWLPMLGDIDKMTATLRHANAVLAQYERDAGKQVRRRYEFPIERTRTESVETGAFPEPSTNVYKSGGRRTLIVETQKRRWFSGAFTYYLPTGYDNRNAMDRAALVSKLLGLEITPDTVWNLAPWSWAADWFSNAGDVVHNISRFANLGLIMRYGYMMEHTIVTHTYKLEGARLISSTGGEGAVFDPATISYVTETKQRVRANPYGFGVSWDGLSPFQISVASALGLSKSR